MTCIYCDLIECKTDFCKKAEDIVNYYNVPLREVSYWIYDYNRNYYCNFLDSLPKKERYKFEDFFCSLQIVKNTINDEQLVSIIENWEKLYNVIYLDSSIEYFENWLRGHIKGKYNF